MNAAQFELHATIEERHWWFVARRRIVRQLIDQLIGRIGKAVKVDKPPLVIDIGCGTGANIASLSDRYRCVGIDTAPDAIHWARQRFPQVEFIEGFAPQDLGERIREAKLITMMDVLEHVADDFQLFSSVLAATSPGTYFLLTVPANMSLWSKHDETFGHYRRYDAERFAAIWRDLPVETLLLSHYNKRLYPLIKAVRVTNRLLRRSAGENGTDFSLPSPPVNWLFQSIFAGEGEVLCDTLLKEDDGYNRGVSLIAVLKRKADPVEPRRKPASAGRDYFDPVAGRLVAAV